MLIGQLEEVLGWSHMTKFSNEKHPAVSSGGSTADKEQPTNQSPMILTLCQSILRLFEPVLLKMQPLNQWKSQKPNKKKYVKSNQIVCEIAQLEFAPIVKNHYVENAHQKA